MKRIGYLLAALPLFASAADVKISALPAGTTIAGTEAIPAVQSAATVKTTPAAIVTYANSATGTLTNKTISGASNTISAVPASAVTAPGSTTQMLYNNAGALAGAQGVTIVDSATSPVVTLNGTASNTIHTANGTTSHPITIGTGVASAGDSGNVSLSTGTASANQVAGTITAGGGNSSADGQGGNVTFQGGSVNGTGGSGGGLGGIVTLSGGSASNGAIAGDVDIAGGVDTSGAQDGAVVVTTNGTGRLLISGLGDWGLGASSVTGSSGQMITSGGAGVSPSWVYPGGVTYFNSTTTGNAAGAGDTSAFSHSVAASTLSADGQTLEFTTEGTFAATANTDKRVRAVFGATTIYDSGSLAITTANSWQLSCKIMRTGAATQKSTCALNTSSTVLPASAAYTTPAETLSGAVTLLIRLNGTSANDVVAQAIKEVCVR